ncbi:hypothetical protein C8R43DRAFT_840089, partial [Mycena crocata]
PPTTPPPFRGRIIHQTPATPFNPAMSKEPVPAGNFLVVRGVGSGDLTQNNPVMIVKEKISELAAADAVLQSIPVESFPVSTRDPTSTCYIRLHPSLEPKDPTAEPRADLLLLWLEKLRTFA